MFLLPKIEIITESVLRPMTTGIDAVSVFVLCCFSSHFFSEGCLVSETVTVQVNGCTTLSRGLPLCESSRVLGIDDVARFSSFCTDDKIFRVDDIPVEVDSFSDILDRVPPSAETVTFSVGRSKKLLYSPLWYMNCCTYKASPGLVT